MSFMQGLVVAAGGALVGTLAGWALGSITKQIEFRFDLLQRLADTYQRTRQAGKEYAEAMSLAQEGLALDRATRIQLGADVGRKRSEFQATIGEALSFPYLVEAAFEDSVENWRAMVSHCVEAIIINDKPDAVGAALSLAVDDWHKFSRGAVGKLGFWPWSSWKRTAKHYLTAGKAFDDFEHKGATR